MAKGIFYEIDGRVGGPVTLMQLQMIASSGMLQPHHRVRKEDSDLWYPARQVKGLFSPTEAAASVTPVSTPSAIAPMTPPPTEEVLWGPAETPQEQAINTAFDFFSDEPAPPPSKKTKAAARPPAPSPPTPAPPRAIPEPAPLPFELSHPGDNATPLADSNEPFGENPFDFVNEAVAPVKKGSQAEDDGAIPVLPAEEELPPDEPPTPPKPEPRPMPAKVAEPKVERKAEAKSATKPEPKPAAKVEEQAAAAAPAATTTPSPSAIVGNEVAGQTVELLNDGTARLLDGKTVFRLQRIWLQAATKFTDGTSRVVYLRLQRIDAGIVEQRLGARHSKSGSYSILSFVAGNVQIALAFQGSDKIYRAFLEKILLMSNASKPPGGK